MPDIFHDLHIHAPPEKVFQAVATPAGLDRWWTKRSQGEPVSGSTYEFWFAPEFDWRGVVRRTTPNIEIEWEFTRADNDWVGTRLGLRLTAKHEGKCTELSFHHTGWPERNAHYRGTCFCWAMYLRLLKRYLEKGETVPYEERLEA